VLTLFPATTPGLDSHLGFVLLFDGQSGEPLAILDASSVTGIRTAAASALATDCSPGRTPRTSPSSLRGAGAEHLAALKEVRPVKRVRVWSRDLERGRRFARPNRPATALPSRPWPPLRLRLSGPT